jgi:predicted DNA-binding protein
MKLTIQNNEIIDSLLMNHYQILMKHLSSYERGKTQSYFKDEAVNAVLNELEHLLLSEYIILEAYKRLDVSLSMEKEFFERGRKKPPMFLSA